MRLLIIVFSLLLLVLQYELWVQRNGVAQTVRLKKVIVKQQAENEDLYKLNRRLIIRIQDLKHNKKAIEGLARQQLGMVKRGEKYYQFKE